jgi:hypothetical protein
MADGVFVLERGRARERAVRVGRINDEFGEVLDGLSERQVVVTNPGSSLGDRMRAKAR